MIINWKSRILYENLFYIDSLCFYFYKQGKIELKSWTKNVGNTNVCCSTFVMNTKWTFEVLHPFEYFSKLFLPIPMIGACKFNNNGHLFASKSSSTEKKLLKKNFILDFIFFLCCCCWLVGRDLVRMEVGTDFLWNLLLMMMRWSSKI